MCTPQCADMNKLSVSIVALCSLGSRRSGLAAGAPAEVRRNDGTKRWCWRSDSSAWWICWMSVRRPYNFGKLALLVSSGWRVCPRCCTVSATTLLMGWLFRVRSRASPICSSHKCYAVFSSTLVIRS